MADKKPIYNPPTASEATSDTTSTKDARRNASAPSRASLFGRRLGVGSIIGISAAGLAVLVGTGFAGAAIANAVDHVGHAPGHVEQMQGQPGDVEAEQGRDGHKGGRGEGDGDGPMDGKTPHQHDANGNDIMPGAPMPGAPMPGAPLPGDQAPTPAPVVPAP